ncbi:hypothetical protein [Flavobacterium sp.]|uniref:hypothetical protein n=1 Tax=Flavobacterium sp. TaxID=239 RepID=UPI0031D71A2E
MEKFEIDVKWSSYFIITNIVTSFIIVLLMLLIDIQSLLYLSNVLIPVFIIQFLYFTIKAIRENKKHDLSRGFRKFFVFTRFFVIYFFVVYLLNVGLQTMIDYPSLMFYHRKKNLSEFLIEDSLSENKDITLNEFIISLKRKFNRA